jgi:hypothetical protein
MACTKRFLGLQWEHHTWRPRVVGFEVFTRPATNMWARVVDEPYMRCDKEQVCAVCGKVGRRVSCICDLQRGETCKFRIDTMASP